MTPLRVALTAADPARAARLAALLREAGHDVADGTGSADVWLVDLAAGEHAPPTAGLPVLALTDAGTVAGDRALAGVLRRSVGATALDAALRAVAAGLQVREAAAASGGFAPAEEHDPPALLTPREMEILAAIGQGLSNKEVARRLGISAHTVKFHLEAVFTKLDASSRAEAVAKGLRRGLIEL